MQIIVLKIPSSGHLVCIIWVHWAQQYFSDKQNIFLCASTETKLQNLLHMIYKWMTVCKEHWVRE